MPRYKSGMTWFEKERYIGTEVTFPGLSSWKIERKIIEHEFCESERYKREPSEARAVFICSNVDEAFPTEAILKIRMQIPWIGTFKKPLHERAEQATDNLSSLATNEMKGLQILTEAGCSSTPALLASKQEKQSSDTDSWVPGGYILYILMEKLPGTTVCDIYHKLDQKEREEVRRSFKQAWIEVFSCGVINEDPADRNLLWDRDAKKCYIVDFEMWYPPGKHTEQGWSDDIYIEYHLARVGEDRNYDDMSTWIL